MIDLARLGAANEYTDPETAAILEEKRLLGHSIGTQLIARVGESRGATTRWVGNYSAVSTLGDTSLLLFGHKGPESFVGARIIVDKLLTRQLLTDAGVATPVGRTVRSADEAIAFAAEAGDRIVLKPRFGMKGKGVSANLRTPDEIAEAYATAAEYGEVLAEAHIDAAGEYRCYASPDECVSVVQRLMPWVMGDGVSTIEQLIARKNEARDLTPSTYQTRIPVDSGTSRHLARQGLDLASIPEAGIPAVVRDIGGVDNGGEPAECFDDVDPAVTEAARAATAAIPGLGWAGCDVLLGTDGVAYVIEVNSDAAINGARYPYYGAPRHLERLIYDMRRQNAEPAPTGAPGRIPPRRLTTRALSRAWDRRDAALPLSELLIQVHEREGWTFARFGRGLVEATAPDGTIEWLQHCSTVRDLEAVHRTVQRSSAMRTLLGHAGVLRPRGRVVTSTHELRDFFDTIRTPMVVLPQRAPWRSSRARLIQSAADLETHVGRIRGRWLAQSVPSGVRCRVIATPERPVAVVAARRLPSRLAGPATDAAVQAVRAVPELRWAAVDVVVRRNAGRAVTALVEGMTLNPVFTRRDRVVAGSLSDVWAVIFGE